jgi:hypothetical protein
MTSSEAAAALGINQSRVRQIIHDLSEGFDPQKLNGTKHGRDWWIEDSEVTRFKEMPRPKRGWQPGRKRKNNP